MNKSGNGILLGDFEKWIKGKNIDSNEYFFSKFISKNRCKVIFLIEDSFTIIFFLIS